MRTPVLVAVDGEPAAFAALLEAAHERGVRVGWLDLEARVAAPEPLASLAAAGAFRAVASNAAGSVVVKPRRGPAPLRDLLREHFLGADVVLVRGLELHPRLALSGDGFLFAETPATTKRLDLEALFARLRRPALRWREKAESESR